ncbi:MAG TPA: KEOPS complex subunit Pcc1 [Methanomicrobiales archaeon]|nr:KEOPS complex subunit Pcc1 [Methanomicrobiales archaeon]
MNWIEGTIVTSHRDADTVAAALVPDNLSSMRTTSTGETVVTAIQSTALRSVIASVDDYLMNLDIAEDVCTCVSH